MDGGDVWFDSVALPPDNEIRRALADWLAIEGNAIAPFVPPPAPIPDDVGKLHFIRALRQLELKALFDQIMGGAGEELQEDFQITNRIVRSDPMTQAFEQAAIANAGVTSEQIDAVFVLAKQLESGQPAE